MTSLDIKLDNFRFDVDDDGVALVTIDVAGATINALSTALNEELVAIIERIEADDAIRAVVITSGKPTGFMVGADIRWLDSLGSDADVAEVARIGHAGFARIERLHAEHGKPVIAAIHGSAKRGRSLVQLAPHADVLRTLAGKQKRDTGLVLRNRPLSDAGDELF